MNDMTVTYEGMSDVRTLIVNDEVWFALVDVCKILELTNQKMVAQRLDDDERGKFSLPRQGETWFVNEAGLYHVILTSKSEKSRPFRRWVTHEVLPSLRKQGFYSMLTPEKLMEVLKEKQHEDSTYLDAIDKQAIKRELVNERRNACVEATRELWLKHFFKYDRATFIGELKRIWAGDAVMFHRYRDKYDKDERLKAKGGIITF